MDVCSCEHTNIEVPENSMLCRQFSKISIVDILLVPILGIKFNKPLIQTYNM